MSNILASLKTPAIPIAAKTTVLTIGIVASAAITTRSTLNNDNL